MKILNIPLEQFVNQLKTFLYGIILYLQIDAQVATALIYLIFLDMFAGSVKSAIVPTLKFSIASFWQGLLKKALLLIIIMVLALTALGLGFSDFRYMVSTVMKIMIVNEAISIFNNIRSVYNRKEYKSSDFISILIEKIESYLSKLMERLMKIFDTDE
jgi:type IV secretory pathway VirB2 component (pilin)